MPSSEVIEQLGSTPISEAAPAGGSARYEPEFEAMEAELDKLSSIQGGEIRWSAVVDNACTLLGSKSKDQLVACYLAYALLEQDGPAGLVEGLKVVDGVCRNFWDTMFPALRKLHARQTAFDWMTERVQQWFEAHPPASSAHADVLAAAELADGISQFCDERMSEVGGSGLFAFVRRLRELADQITPAAETESQTAADEGGSGSTGTARSQQQDAAASARPAAGVQRATPLGGLDANSIQQVREEAFRRLRDLAVFFTEAEPHSPVGPMLQRVSRWAEMDYRQLYAELLRGAQSGQESLWDILNLDEAESPAGTGGGGGGDAWSEPATGGGDVEVAGREDDW